MKNKLLFSFMVVLLAVTNFSCSNILEDEEADTALPTIMSNYNTPVVFTYGGLSGKYAGSFGNKVVTLPKNSVPTSITLFSETPTDPKIASNLKKAFDNGVPIGLVGANPNSPATYESLSKLLEVGIDFSKFANPASDHSDDILVVTKNKYTGDLHVFITGFDTVVTTAVKATAPTALGSDPNNIWLPNDSTTTTRPGEVVVPDWRPNKDDDPNGTTEHLVLDPAHALNNNTGLKPGYDFVYANQEIKNFGYDKKAPPSLLNFTSAAEIAAKNAMTRNLFEWAKTSSKPPVSSSSGGLGAGQIDLNDIASTYHVHRAVPESIEQATNDYGQVFKFPIINVDYDIKAFHLFNEDFTDSTEQSSGGLDPKGGDYYVMEKVTERDVSSIYWSEDQAAGKLCTYWYEVANWTAEAETWAWLTADPDKQPTSDKPNLPEDYKYADKNPDKIQLLKEAPNTSTETVSQSETFSFSVEANAGVSFAKGGTPTFAVGVKAGFGYSSTRSRSYDSLAIEKRIGNGTENHYFYTTNSEQFLQDRTDQDAPAVARSTLTTAEMWLWHLKEQQSPANFSVEGKERHRAGRRSYHVFAAGGRDFRYMDNTHYYTFPLPIPPHFVLMTPNGDSDLYLNFEGKLSSDNTVLIFDVLSHDSWTITGIPDWITLSSPDPNDSIYPSGYKVVNSGNNHSWGSDNSSGNKCRTVVVSCNKSYSNKQRTATLTFTEKTSGETITMNIFQEANPNGIADLKIYSTNVDMDANGGSKEIEVIGQESWTAEIADNGKSWCHLDQYAAINPQSDKDFDHNITISADPNRREFPRQTTITFTTSSGKSIVVTVRQNPKI